jgi:hypothetical protein
VPHIVVFEKSPHPNVKDQVLDMVQNYLTELSMTAIPPSNYLHAFYKWLLAAEVDQYIYLMGKRDDCGSLTSSDRNRKGDDGGDDSPLSACRTDLHC